MSALHPGRTDSPQAVSAADEGLLPALRRREPTAQRAFFDRYAQQVFTRAFQMTGDAALAEDLTQDAFVRAFSRIEQFRGESSLSTWLHAVANSVILNGIRSVRSRAAREVPLEPVHDSAITTEAEPDLKGDIRAALQALAPDLRVVVLMYEVEGYSHDEIAAAVGISAGASRMRLNRARAALRDALRAHAPGGRT